MMAEEASDWEEEDVSSEVSESKRDSLNLNSLDCWDYSIELECLKSPEDLQLAAELGKTLLERNKELETSLRQCQNIIDEQAQEIEYLTKQSTALRKANDNRIRIYEHLEVSIQELERANQRLALDNSTDKKQIKSLCAYRDMLESRCEELQKALDESRVQQTIQKEKLRRMSTKDEETTTTAEPQTKTTAVSQTSIEQIPEEEDLINQLSTQNQELKSQISRDQRKIADLEDDIFRRVQDMALLEEELCQREEQVKSLREKLSNLEEVRSENLCARCLKELDLKMFDPEEDSFSDGDKYCSSVHLDNKDEFAPDVSLFGGIVPPSGFQVVRPKKETPELAPSEDNPYRTLAEMYESIVKEQSEHRKLSIEFPKSSPQNCLSLQDELKAFDFNGMSKEQEEDEETRSKDERKEEQRNMGKNKMFMSMTPDFLEAETSSSGFSDETSNKSTQTERNQVPGSFLCSIADGDDCKFSIYDDACPIESRFRKTPEYRTLFREIFAVLKRAAEEKDNGEQLPLLDDLTPVSEAPKVPPVTPAKEEPPIDLEDLQSLPESSNMSEVASETSSTVDARLEETLKDTPCDDSPTQEPPVPSSTARDVRLTNDILEYISVGIGVKKKSKRKSTNSPARRARVAEMVEKIEGSVPNSPRKSGRRRKEWKNYDSPRTGSRTQSPAIQPHVLTTLERKETPPNSQNRSSSSARTSSWLFQPFVSTAAQEVAKLKKLEKSYAEVLRHRPVPKSYGRPKNLRLAS